MTALAALIVEQYNNGKRVFEDLDLDNENFDGENLEGVTFNRCFLYSSFKKTNLKNARFTNGNVKTCDFRGSDLTNAHFENVSVEGARFAGSKTEGIYFDDNWCYGNLVTQADFHNFIKDDSD